jgi:hypothetical protein
VDWLWPGYVARGGVTLLTGLWKAGKTTLIGHLLRDLYRGEGLTDSPIDGPTLILSEEPNSLWATRRDSLGLTNSVRLAMRETFAKPSRPEWTALLADVARTIEREGAALVVFDTLPSLWPVLNENDAGEVVEALAPLRDLNRAGAGVLLLHHPRKGEGEQGQASRGSGALPGFVDVLVELRRFNPEDSSDKRRKLTAYGRFEGIPPELVIELAPEGYRVLGEPADVRQADVLSTIEAMLPDHGAGLTAEEITDAWPSTMKPGKTRLRGLLNQGAHDGRWMRVGMGVRNDPYTYRKAADSFQSPPCLSGRNEMKPSGEAQA